MKKVALGLIWLYQRVISPITPPACRYQPTCSHYGYEAINKHGFWKGGWMTAWRIMRCNPFSKGGFDPVP
ncbi:MAG: membrane protein insertion efficiency factor YidD [Chloroflexi bacterium]|nr:membrane protein insertion efficiency factor YidD [Chloroflexota bacterium]